MNRIENAFKNKPIFMPYFPLGYPDLDTSIDVIEALAKNGKPVALTLTLEELNTLIVLGGETGVADYRGMVRFTGLDAPTKALKADIRWKMNNLPLIPAPERFLVGSDTWINARWSGYELLMAEARVWLGELPPAVARRIGWDNGARLFGLPEPAPR